MIALYIVGGLLVLLSLLLLLKLTFRFSWCSGLLLEVKIGFYTIKKEFEPALQREETEDKTEAETAKKPKTEKESGVPFKELFPIIRETVSSLAKKLKKHLKIEKYILRINVASDDPAKTAILYGAVSASAASLQTYIDTLNISTKKGRIYTEVKPDFISEKTDILVDIALSVRVWQGLSILLPLITGYKKYKLLKTKADGKTPHRKHINGKDE